MGALETNGVRDRPVQLGRARRDSEISKSHDTQEPEQQAARSKRDSTAFAPLEDELDELVGHAQQLAQGLEKLREHPAIRADADADAQLRKRVSAFLTRRSDLFDDSLGGGRLVRTLTDTSVEGTQADDTDFGLAKSQLEEACGTRNTVHEDMVLELVTTMAIRLQTLLANVGIITMDAPPDGRDATEVCEKALAALEAVSPQLHHHLQQYVDASSVEAWADGALATPSLAAPSTVVASEEDQHACHVCGAKLGKRYLKPKHRCRSCDRDVCGKCSPSAVKHIENDTMVRICNPCVANAFGRLA